VRSFAASASVSLKIELDREGVTRSRIIAFVIDEAGDVDEVCDVDVEKAGDVGEMCDVDVEKAGDVDEVRDVEKAGDVEVGDTSADDIPPEALISLSISLESCQRFGPTCCPKNSASAWAMWPPRLVVSSVIQRMSSYGDIGANSSVVAVLFKALNKEVRLSGILLSLKTTIQKSGISPLKISTISF